jgi:hypothetical protein
MQSEYLIDLEDAVVAAQRRSTVRKSIRTSVHSLLHDSRTLGVLPHEIHWTSLDSHVSTSRFA